MTFAKDNTAEKCLPKIKYLVDNYKEKKEWNKNQTGGNIRKSIVNDEIGAALGVCYIVILRHVLGTDDSSKSRSVADDVSSDSSQGQKRSPKKPVAAPKSPLERKKGQGKQKRKLDGIGDGEYKGNYKCTIDDIKGKGECCFLSGKDARNASAADTVHESVHEKFSPRV